MISLQKYRSGFAFFTIQRAAGDAGNDLLTNNLFEVKLPLGFDHDSIGDQMSERLIEMKFPVGVSATRALFIFWTWFIRSSVTT